MSDWTDEKFIKVTKKICQKYSDMISIIKLP